jgi:hypothetical protein
MILFPPGNEFTGNLVYFPSFLYKLESFVALLEAGEYHLHFFLAIEQSIPSWLLNNTHFLNCNGSLLL